MKIIYFQIILGLLFIGCGTTTNITINKTHTIKPIQEPSKIKSIIKSTKESEKIQYLPNTPTIGLVFSSSKIGKYALEIASSLNSYIVYKNIKAKIMLFDTDKIDINSHKIIEILKFNKISKAIILCTNKDIELINSIQNKDIQFYFPLINKNDIPNIVLSDNLLFGAIDYKKQFSMLIDYTNGKRFVDFYDNTSLGNTLHSYINQDLLIYEKQINDNNGQYKLFLRRNKKLVKSIIILNTPIVKSSILLSQINGLNIPITKIISTQLNYTPLLLSLTQKDDRKNIILANSIGYIPNDFVEYTQLIGNNIQYSWVNYASVVGLEYFISNNIDLFHDLSIQNNQIIYPVKLYKVRKHSFKEIIN